MLIKSITVKLFLLLSVAISIFAIFLVSYNYEQYRTSLDKQAQQSLDLALEFDFAIRRYVATTIRPIMTDLIGQDKFVPETMSTSFVARSIFEDVQRKSPNFILKYSSKNPKNEKNIANKQEEEIIDFFNANPDQTKWRGHMTIDKQQYNAMFKANRAEQSCLRCHGKPEDAPPSIINLYGDKAGFHYKEGQIIALDIIAAKHLRLEAALIEHLMHDYPIILLTVLGLFCTIFLGIKFLIINRITLMSHYFNEIANSNDYTNIHHIQSKGHDEIDILTNNFNILADKISTYHISLNKEVTTRNEINEQLQTRIKAHQQTKVKLQELYDNQEILIEKRTAELSEANYKLEEERRDLAESYRELKETKAELEKNNKILREKRQKQDHLLNMVENAKYEWDLTMDCIHDMVVLTNKDLVIKRCNGAVIKFTGTEYNKLIGKRWPDLLDDNKMVRNKSNDHSIEYYHEPSKRWFHLNTYTLNNKSGGKVITLHDLTKQKQTNQTLEEKSREIDLSRQKLQMALNSISELIIRVTEEQTFDVYFSHPDLEKCWLPPKCKEKDCPYFDKDPLRCWQLKGDLTNNDSCKTCQHYTHITSDPIYQIGEQFNNMMRILAAQNKKVEDAYTELNRTQSQLLQQEKMASIGQLAAGVAHEINNPMGFISSNLGSLSKYIERLSSFVTFQTDVMQKYPKTEAINRQQEQRQKLKLDFIQKDIIELIDESLDGCERVKKIVQDLKGFSRIDEANTQHADINECLETTLNIVRNELKYKAIIKKDYGELTTIKCYPQQLNQVFMNLLINAAHAIKKEGVIKIKTWQDENFLYTSITDNGLGMSPANLKRIFEPFFTTKEVGKGTGLGLSIVYDIITKKHKGDIKVVSEEGKGTTFTVKLPIN